MKVTRRSSLAEVAAAVSEALRRAGIDAVLTGGACATFYSEGAYQSHDLDFIIRAGGTRRSLDQAMSSAGFARDGDRYTHPESPFFVEFPRGPLAIGDDLAIIPVELKVGDRLTPALSATDTCRDRLAAFYHWSDRQSLNVAVQIGLRARVNMSVVRRWSIREGFESKFGDFEAELKRAKRRRRS